MVSNNLQIPSRKAEVQKLQSYFQTNVPEWDVSTSRRSFVGGLVKSIGSALNDWYVALKKAADQFFPQTASGLFLTQGWWATLTKLSPNPAAPAQGTAVFTGTVGTLVPAGTELTANNLTYTVDHDVSIVTQSINITSLTSAGGVATATTAAPHLLATGLSPTMSGAAQTEYNVTAAIIVTGDYTFTYPITGAPASPATGTPKLTATYADGAITCTTKGQATNIDGGGTLAVAVTNVDPTALVTFAGIAGGTDIETPESYRARVMQALGTDFGMFTGDEIEILAKTVPGVTRVWVRKAAISPPTGWPLEGQVFVAFMRDNDINPFPTSQEVNAVYNQIASRILPAHTAPEDLVVSSPTPQAVDFTFTALSPDTATMRAAIQASLVQFFKEGVDYGVNVLQDDYRCAIRDTYDPQGRARLKSFSLSAPSGDVTVSSSNLATLGTLTWPT